MPTYEERLKGVKLPVEIIIPELQRREVSLEDIDDKRCPELGGLFYKRNGHYISATRHFDFLPDGQGVIAAYLKKGEPLDRATFQVKELLKKVGTEELYTEIRVFLTNNRELSPPLYVLTTVAQWK
jgi:hypothetical protein